MAAEIFISYRRADEAWARLLYNQLRAQGVEAWYDALVGAGQDWRTATAKALEDSRIFVLLFSENAAQSSDIVKELAAATLEKKLVVPVRLQNIAPKGAFLYELASRNWINAFEDTENKLAQLAGALAHLVRSGARDEAVLPFDRGLPVPARRQTYRPLLMAAAVLAIFAAAAIALWLYPHSRPAQQVATAKPPPSANAAPAGISVAVLPFVNLSPDKDQEFFSDGMTEEITSALARVPGLTVIGRTSAYQFKGENRDLRAIGRTLGARNLIEGSVRKAGAQLRITAQLINAADGTNLWTESYDRKLTDIFAVQEDIARAIAGALQVPLGLKQGESLISNRTADTESYQDYLRAIALFRGREIPKLREMVKAVIARDPGFAPAWALLAQSYIYPAVYAPLEDMIGAGASAQAREYVATQYDSLEKAARQAIRLDPRNALAYDALGTLENMRGHWTAGEDYMKQALAIDPNNPDILYNRGFQLATTGHIKEALRVQARILAEEPFVPVYRSRQADLLWTAGQNDAALQILKDLPAAGPTSVRLAKLYATMGQYARAADTLLSSKPLPGAHSAKSLDDAARLLHSAPAKAGAPDALPLLPGDLGFVYLFIGAEGRSLEFVEREFDVNYYGGTYRDPWAPPSAALRNTERFKAFARKAGFVEYWRQRGWPDACHPVGADDFACA